MKQRGKKSLKITDAIVRGSKNAYEFEVFPIETEFEPQSAIYIFSQRKTDKTGRGHQKFFCIGQTDSLDGEFSKFKKQFALKYKANVICVRIEEEENLRLRIEEELKTAYNISCSTNIEKAPAKTEKRTSAKQISERKKTIQPKKELPIQKPQENHVRKPLAEKAIKTAAKKDAVKKINKTNSKKIAAKKIAAEKKNTVQNKNLNVKSKAAKSTALKSKAKKAKQEVKSTPIKTKRTPATKNKIESKKLKSVSIKSKSNKVSKPLKNQKNSGSKKSQSNGNGKILTKNKQKPAAQKVTGKGKNRTTKTASRKQLAF